MTNPLITVMEKIGKDALKLLSEVVKYLPTAAALATEIFPGAAGATAGAVNSIQLIQSAVTTVEQKMAAAGAQSGTGAQKLADVLTMVTPTVTQLLTAEKIPANTVEITNIVNAVVAILKVQTTSAA